MPSLRYLRLTMVLAGIICVGGAPAMAQSVRKLGSERVTVKAEGVALGDLLEQLAAITPLETLRIDPADRTVPVSLEVEDVHPLEAMALVLKASGLDFVMSSKRVVAGRAAKASELAAATGRRELTRLETTREDVSDRRSANVTADDEARRKTEEHRVAAPLGTVSLGLGDGPRAASAAPEASLGAVVSGEPPASMGVKETALAIPGQAADEFSSNGGARQVPFAVHEDSASVTEPGFVPYKLRPEVIKRRLAAKVGDVP